MVAINQSQNAGVYIDVGMGLDWTSPGTVSASLTGLPDGVTARWVQTQAYDAALQEDIEGYFALSASVTAAVGGSTPQVLLQSGSQSFSWTGLILLDVMACTPSACSPGQCNTPANICGGTIECGECSLGEHCTPDFVCEETNAPTCPAGTHSCGGGICAKVCE